MYVNVSYFSTVRNVEAEFMYAVQLVEKEHRVKL